jgi:hypothetical protein
LGGFWSSSISKSPPQLWHIRIDGSSLIPIKTAVSLTVSFSPPHREQINGGYYFYTLLWAGVFGSYKFYPPFSSFIRHLSAIFIFYPPFIRHFHLLLENLFVVNVSC